MWWKEYRITKIKSKNIFNSESFGNILKCINNRLTITPPAPPTTCKPSEFAKGLISYFQLYFKLQANQVSLFNIELGHKTFQQKYGWLIFINVQYQITRRVFVWQIYIDCYFLRKKLNSVVKKQAFNGWFIECMATGLFLQSKIDIFLKIFRAIYGRGHFNGEKNSI